MQEDILNESLSNNGVALSLKDVEKKSDSKNEVFAHYRALTDALAAKEHPYPAERFEGKGVVICAGGWKYFPPAWVAINMLRHFGCTLPIEIWYLGKREWIPEMSKIDNEKLNFTWVNSDDVAKKLGVRPPTGWESKVFSIMHSSFKEVMYLDGDNVPCKDPTYMFDCEPYKATGSVFWPDYRSLEPNRSIWQICGVPFVSEKEFESGQIVVDKSRCWKPLQVTSFMNENSEFYYQHIWGDKDTFHMAWRICKVPFSLIPTPIQPLKYTMCQHDFEGRRIFQHRNCAKWVLHETNIGIPGFDHEKLCLSFLRKLRTMWGIKVGEYQDSHPDIAQLKQRLIDIRFFRYTRVGYDSRRLELLPNHRIGDGKADLEKEWHIQKAQDKVYVVISGDKGITCRLAQVANDVWKGRWERYEKMPIELRGIYK